MEFLAIFLLLKHSYCAPVSSSYEKAYFFNPSLYHSIFDTESKVIICENELKTSRFCEFPTVQRI
ncbi:hypothetical protein DSO57_1012913 [Entomophthora muscae]|uniref:Uncharacterized protein n=1 Tax=Entomophthora muscae TaxID=34485 RepID=A0ACC2T5X4_9FUNG|nr:hypothetical protein DSO57_1012913 [Entomophthora muscae]